MTKLNRYSPVSELDMETDSCGNFIDLRDVIQLIVKQCGSCVHNPRWEITKQDFEDLRPGRVICDEYPDGIPDFVEDGIKDCPKYKPKE